MKKSLINNKNMRILFVYIAFLSIGYTSCSQETVSRDVNELNLDERGILLILDQLYEEEIANYNWTRSVCIINTKKVEQRYEIRVSFVYREDLDPYISESHAMDSLYGYFEFRKMDALVFGNEADVFFHKSGEKKSISYLNVGTHLHEKEGKESTFSPPPLVFEPLVWIYAYDRGDFSYVDKGLFHLLD